MKEKIQFVSIVVIAVVLLGWAVYFVTSSFLDLQGRVNEITNFLTQQIQRSQAPIQTPEVVK